MTPAVFDASVVVSGAGWRSESFRCLVHVARRRVRVFASTWITEEIERTAKDMDRRKRFPHDPWPILNWFFRTAVLVDPAALGKQRSRDASDDPYLAAALVARARYIVSRDNDLLIMQKPFGVSVVTPRAFLHEILSA
jgi:putative PIN family toxin of toxin-antitoxin system